MNAPKQGPRLHEYLANHLPTEKLQHVMLVLWPFMDVGKVRYPFVSAKDLDPRDIQDALRVALRKAPDQIEFVPYDSLPRDIPVIGFADSLRRAWGRERYASIPQPLFDALFHNPMGRILTSLTRTLPPECSPDTESEKRITAVGYDSILAPLALFLDSTIRVEDEVAQAIETLIPFLACCIPFGERQDRTGTWVVLTAP